jgi:hypothetical protein
MAAWAPGALKVENKLRLQVMESSAKIAPSVTTSLVNRCILFLSVHFIMQHIPEISHHREGKRARRHKFFVMVQASKSPRFQQNTKMAPICDEVALRKTSPP